MDKKLGKLKSVEFGLGGYQEACIGINVQIDFDGSGVGDSKTAWDANLIECTSHCKWTEEDRSAQYAEIVRYISGLLADAKVSNVSQLIGKPVEVTMDGMQLKSWRILKEVL